MHHLTLMGRRAGLVGGKKALAEVASHCVATRARLLSRVLTGIYDDAYRPFGVNAPQLILLTVVSRIGPASRAEIGRFNHQDRSTLSRNLAPMLSAGWIQEIERAGKGRARPLAITERGRQLLLSTVPAWRCAQAKAVAILGEAAAAAITEIGDSLIKA